MMQNQSKQVTSWTTTRLSPLAKPFTLNRSTLQPCSSSLFSGYPFLESPKEGDFDGFVEDFSLPIFLPLGHGNQGGDSHDSSFLKGSDVADSTTFHEVKHVVHGSTPCLIESAGTGTIVAEDLLSNSKGTIHAANESTTSPFSNCKVSPLKLSTTNMSSSKNTSQNQSSNNLVESDSDVDSPCWKGTMAYSGSIQISNVDKATEKHNSLNPLAPQFFPRIGYVKDDCGSSNSCVPVATNLLSGEDMLVKTIRAESTVELKKGIELQPSSNTCGGGNVFNTFNDPKSSYVDPVLTLHGMVTQSSCKEDCSMSKGKLDTVVDVDNVVRRTKDPRICSSVSDAFPAKGLSSITTLAACGIGVVNDPVPTLHGMVTQSSSKEDCSMSKGKLETVVDVDNFVKRTKDPRICSSVSDAFPAKGLSSIPTLAASGIGVVTDPVLTLHGMVTQSSSKVDCSMSKGKLETVVDVDNFVKRTEDSRICKSVSDAFPAKGLSSIPTLAASGIGVVTDLLKTFEGVSTSLIESPKPDVRLMLSAIHVLSELLVLTSMDGVDSNNDHGHDEIVIQQIINNLNDFSTKSCGQMIQTLDSTPADNPFFLDGSSELPKGLEMTSVDTLNDPNFLHQQNGYMGDNRVIQTFGQSGSRYLASSSEGQCKGNEIAKLQIIRRSLGKTLDFDKHMHPEALLFLNLWLDSEAERCYRKYKTYHCLMEAGLDVNCTTVAELLS